MLIDLVVDAVARLDKLAAPYRLEIHVVNCERLGLPDNIKKTQGDAIMLSIQGDRNPDVKYDFEARELSWHASFNHAPWRVYVHIEDIIGINSPYTGDIVTFARLRAEKTNTNMAIPARGIVPKPATPPVSKPKLSVITNKNYDESKKGTGIKPNLKIVKNKDSPVNKTE